MSENEKDPGVHLFNMKGPYGGFFEFKGSIYRTLWFTTSECDEDQIVCFDEETKRKAVLSAWSLVKPRPDIMVNIPTSASERGGSKRPAGLRRVRLLRIEHVSHGQGSLTATEELVDSGEIAYFHEFIKGSRFPLAIVEAEDGSVKNVPADLIKFVV